MSKVTKTKTMKLKPFQKLLTLMISGKPVTIEEIDTLLGKEIYMYRLSTYIWHIKTVANGVVKAALNIIKALPGVKIYLHEDSDQYAQEVSARVKESIKIKEDLDEAGSYIDGEIHIDMSKADLITLLHEAFHHAFLTLGIKNGMFIDLAKGLRSLVTDKATLAELDEFVANYSEETAEMQAEEFATQLGAILANNRKELTTTKLTLVI